MRKQFAKVLPGLVGGAIGGAAAVLVLYGGLGVRVSPLVLLLLPAILWLAIAVHEAGHLAGGRLAGFAPLLMAVGPMLLVWERGRPRLRSNRNLAWWGGLAASLPADAHNLRRRMLLIVAAGPSTSLLIGAVAFVAGRLADGEMSASLLTLGGVASMGLGVATLWPGQTGGFSTDGARLIRLSRDTADTDRAVATLAIIAQSMAGVRPRDLDPDLVRRAIGVEDGSSSEVTGWMIKAEHDLDTGRIEQARAHFSRVLDQLDALPPVTCGGFVLEAAFVAAFHDNDPTRAKALLDSARDDLFTARVQQPLAMAAIAIASHDAEGARAALDDARRVLPDVFDAGHRVVTADRIDRLQARIESAS